MRQTRRPGCGRAQPPTARATLALTHGCLLGSRAGPRPLGPRSAGLKPLRGASKHAGVAACGHPGFEAAVELADPATADVERLVAWVERMREGKQPVESESGGGEGGKKESGGGGLPQLESLETGKKDEL